MPDSQFNPRYERLKAAYHTNQNSWDRYEKTCRKFVERLRKELVSYLNCLDDKVILLPLSDEEHDIIRSALEGCMHLHPCGFWHFTIRLHLDQATGGGVDLRYRVKRVDSKFVVMHGDHEIPVEVGEDGAYALDGLLEYTYKQAKDYLTNRFDVFLRGEPEKSSIGFARPSASTHP